MKRPLQRRIRVRMTDLLVLKNERVRSLPIDGAIQKNGPAGIGRRSVRRRKMRRQVHPKNKRMFRRRSDGDSDDRHRSDEAAGREAWFLAV